MLRSNTVDADVTILAFLTYLDFAVLDFAASQISELFAEGFIGDRGNFLVLGPPLVIGE